MNIKIYANKTLSHPTYFSQPVSLIKETLESKMYEGLCSENWPWNIGVSYGFSGDNYYAEIWVNGMDWQKTYWIIESINFKDPTATPLIYFDSHKNRSIFNDYDFDQLLKAMMHYRRDRVWLQKDKYAHFGDIVWPYVSYIPTKDIVNDNKWGMRPLSFEHGSQKKVTFSAAADFIPTRVLEPMRVFLDFDKMMESVKSHPFSVTYHRQMMCPKGNTLKEEDSISKEYVGYSCLRTRARWIIDRLSLESDFVFDKNKLNELNEEKI